MTPANVKLILAREIRDQLRDRRTLFMIVVLPLLLYPLLGMSFFQLAQFLREKPTRILVVSAREFDDLPPLFENEWFSPLLFSDPERSRLLELRFAPDEPKTTGSDIAAARAEAISGVESGQYDAALYFPPDFARRLAYFRQAIEDRPARPVSPLSPREGQGEGVQVSPRPSGEGQGEGAQYIALPVPRPEIIYSTANEKSQIAFARLSEVLRNWTESIGKKNLEAGGLPNDAIKPFTLDSSDVALVSGNPGAAAWAKIMPMLLLLWALTGAFYPAIDLCAGEKERGTLETLLSSPARRSEIVLGKLLTIMLFSVVTAVLNLVSLAISISAALAHFKILGPPPLISIVWLLLALLPISALFGAVCLALAAFARSTKEGQYYLMPLLVAAMPLVILPMSPGMELNLGNSLIPVTGVMLLLRSLMEGHYLPAAQYAPVVIGVTLASCILAIRWAVEQFNSEAVLFRESERLEVGLWLRRLFRERRATPGAAGAVFCCMVMILLRFFLGFSMSQPGNFNNFARVALFTQLAVILAPALLMSAVLAGSPRETLLLRLPKWQTIPAALLLAVFLHPLANVLQSALMELYPVSEGAKLALENIQQLLLKANLWHLLLVIALVPAICEELAFRGFVLSGFRHIGCRWRAIALSAFFFGVVHGVIQQSLLACLVGLVLGFLAVQSGSIIPCMVFHVAHNSLAVLNSRLTPSMFDNLQGLEGFIIPGEHGGCAYPWSVVIFAAFAALLLLLWFALLPYLKTPEEELRQAAARGEAQLELVPEPTSSS